VRALACAAGLVVVGGCLRWGPERDESGTIVVGGELGVDEIEVGDCFQGVEDMRYHETMYALPCSTPHIYEVYAVFDIEDRGEPSERQIEDLATTGCWARWSEAVARIDDDELGLWLLAPSGESWATGDREVICFVTRMDGSPLEGSLRAR
jgi:putative regulator of septum formation